MRLLARMIDGFILSIPTIMLVVPLAIMLGLAARPARLLPFGLAALMVQGVLMLSAGPSEPPMRLISCRRAARRRANWRWD